VEASTEQDAKAQADAERAEREAAKQAERDAKARAKAEEKERKAKEAAEAKAAKTAERIAKIVGEVEWEGDAPTPETVEAARELVKARKAELRANRPKKAPLTLSQRRAVLNLADAGKKGLVPKTGFNALPLDHLVGVGLAETFQTKTDKVEKVTEGEGDDKKTVEKTVKVDATGYRLTDAGIERAKEINPKWQTWKPEREETPAAS
jgi:hypothetical protein